MELLTSTESSIIYMYGEWVVKVFSNEKVFTKENDVLQSLHKKLQDTEKSYFCLNVDKRVVNIELPVMSLVFPRFTMNLHDYLTRGENIESFDIADFYKQISKALDILHRKFIHNDIKPQNIFVDLKNSKSIRFVIGDFGITTLNSERKTTRPIGTPLYMSPFIATTCEVSPMNDQWSYACILINIFTLYYVDSDDYADEEFHSYDYEDEEFHQYEEKDDKPSQRGGSNAPRKYLHLLNNKMDKPALLYAIPTIPEQLKEAIEILSKQSFDVLYKFDEQASYMYKHLSGLKSFPSVSKEKEKPCTFIIQCLSKFRYIPYHGGWVFLTDPKRQAIIQHLMDKVLQILLEPTWLSVKASR